MLQEGIEGARSVQEFTPYFVLGNGDRVFGVVGFTFIIRVLEAYGSRSNRKYLFFGIVTAIDIPGKWSKATYTYGVAACLLQIGGEAELKEAKRYIGKVEGLRQRIAGKSIPLEV